MIGAKPSVEQRFVYLSKTRKKKSPQCFEDISDYEGIQLKFMQSNQCLQELQLGKR